MDSKDYPEFASPDWLKLRLQEILTDARALATEHYLANAQNPRIDFDAYSYILLPRRKRRLWRFLQEISSDLPWLQTNAETGYLEIAPDCHPPSAWTDPAADQLMVEHLRLKGLPVRHIVHNR